MRKNSKWSILLLVLLLVLTCFSACGNDTDQQDQQEPNVPTETVVPDEVQAVKDHVTSLAAEYALKLDGDWGDQHAALMATADEESYDEALYNELKAVLDGYREECGAYYVYALYGEAPYDEAFNITIDGSPEPDDWFTEYEFEIQFKEAAEGEPAAARSAWDDSEDDLCWSAFAPVHDSEGNVVAILGIDYPAPEILDFPEWNRDSEEWNGIEE